MKRQFFGWIMMALVVVSVRAVAEEAPAVEPSKVFALVAAGPVEEASLQRVKAFVEEYVAVPIRILPPQEAKGTTLHEEGEALVGLRAETDVALVALVSPAEEQPEHAVYLYDQHVAVVNARVLKLDADEETYGRRLEKLVVRSMALLLGIEPVPNPQSALFPYRDIEQLDTIARTLDPPTLAAFQRAAAERGVKLIEGSPFLQK